MQTGVLDLLDVDPFDLVEDEEPFAPAAKADAAASVAELLERALRVIAEYEKPSRRAPARRARRKARVTAHLPGQHNQQDHAGVSSINAIAGIDVMDAEQYADAYGEVWDDAGVNIGGDGGEPTLTARFFERGDLHVVLDLEDGKSQVFEDMDPEGLRQLAYNLEDVLAVDETEFEADDPYDIVADADSDKHGFYVAKNGVGDIRIRPPDAAEDDYLELSEQQAREFAGKLLDIADGYEEHFADDSEVVASLVTALGELSEERVAAAKFDPSEHPRNPAGKGGGGRFRSTVDQLKDAISSGKGDPFKDFDREQLRRAAKTRGIELKRGEDRESIAQKLLADLGVGENKPAPEKKPTPRKKAEPKAKPEPKAATPKTPARKKAAPKASGDAVTGHAALAVPPRNLEAMTAANDPRADALWYRAGDNSKETESGLPGSFEMSTQMRGGEKMTPETKARVKAIDSVMAESKLPEPILVYRGAERLGGVRPDEAIGEGRNLVGREFTDKAFVSTSTDADHATWFGGTVLRIKVPPGTSAIRMADRKGTERDQQESEILLDRGLTYRVVAQYGRGQLKGDWGGAYVLDLEVVS